MVSSLTIMSKALIVSFGIPTPPLVAPSGGKLLTKGLFVVPFTPPFAFLEGAPEVIAI